MSCNIPLGRHRTSHRRIWNVCHENGGEPLHFNNYIRSFNSVWYAQHERSNHILPIPIPICYYWSVTCYIQETTEQEHLNVHDAWFTFRPGHRYHCKHLSNSEIVHFNFSQVYYMDDLRFSHVLLLWHKE